MYKNKIKLKQLLLTLVILPFLSGAIFPQLPPVKLDYSSYALSSDGRLLGYYGEKHRVEVRSTGNISKWVIYSLIATEDRDFYNHDGVSYKGLGRAVIKTLTGSTQGGSTLTMQLARNLFLSREQTITRKLTEINIAREIEKKYTKDQI
ncbi:MAG: transglycosylase domain-containing protein, partial [Acidobacteriota bacterium]